MLPAEPQIFKFLSEHYPTLLIALMTISLAVYGALKLNAFFGRIEALEKELVLQKADWVLVKMKVAKLTLIHCKRHAEDMDTLMRVESDDGKP